MSSSNPTRDDYLWAWMQAVQPPAQRIPPTLGDQFHSYSSTQSYETDLNSIPPSTPQSTAHQPTANPNPAPGAHANGWNLPPHSHNPHSIGYINDDAADQVMYSDKDSNDGDRLEGVEDDDDCSIYSGTRMSWYAPTEQGEPQDEWEDVPSEESYSEYQGEEDEGSNSQGLGHDEEEPGYRHVSENLNYDPANNTVCSSLELSTASPTVQWSVFTVTKGGLPLNIKYQPQSMVQEFKGFDLRSGHRT
jgi:hypothetical protein